MIFAATPVLVITSSAFAPETLRKPAKLTDTLVRPTLITLPRVASVADSKNTSAVSCSSRKVSSRWPFARRSALSKSLAGPPRVMDVLSPVGTTSDCALRFTTGNAESFAPFTCNSKFVTVAETPANGIWTEIVVAVAFKA